MAYAILFLVLLLADQLTKAAAYAAYGESVDLIKGWLGIEAVPQNTGISFGLPASEGQAQVPARIARADHGRRGGQLDRPLCRKGCA